MFFLTIVSDKDQTVGTTLKPDILISFSSTPFQYNHNARYEKGECSNNFKALYQYRKCIGENSQFLPVNNIFNLQF
jgi:hypothetical protein